MKRAILAAVVLAAGMAITGCYGQVHRSITIDSEPQGALCWLNENEVGRTPCTVPFTWYGTYEVRLEASGYEPLVSTAAVRAPMYEWLGADLAFETVVPGNRYDTHAFRFALKRAEPVDPDALRGRAEGLRTDAKTPEP
ncbi:MAG: PEGA domain-containing protein [Phycisphaerae bacterium]|nr:PEGA domain-containing protein [Phycisphaerae bacterium]